MRGLEKFSPSVAQTIQKIFTTKVKSSGSNEERTIDHAPPNSNFDCHESYFSSRSYFSSKSSYNSTILRNNKVRFDSKLSENDSTYTSNNAETKILYKIEDQNDSHEDNELELRMDMDRKFDEDIITQKIPDWQKNWGSIHVDRSRGRRNNSLPKPMMDKDFAYSDE